METTEVTYAAVEAIQEQVDKASGFVDKMGDYISRALPLFIIAVIMLIIGIFLSKLISKIFARTLKNASIDGTAKNFLVSLVRIFLYVIVIIMALSVINVPMSSIITIFGAAGLAVSLALQNCLSNICGGFILLFSKLFSAGDMIEFDGTVGKVEAIGILYTKICTLDNKTVFIPNGKVSDAKIINYTESPTRRIDLCFDISYSADYEKVRGIILELIDENKKVLKSPAPVVRMSAHKESSVAIDVLVWVLNDDYYSVRYDITEAVKSGFDGNNIEIPFSQLDVHMK
ncbi:MAG: mechanosensitive ion channel [Ruminococcus sp.]|nr:mechanosensitive ion channel [Ruminococcus sp.]